MSDEEIGLSGLYILTDPLNLQENRTEYLDLGTALTAASLLETKKTPYILWHREYSGVNPPHLVLNCVRGYYG